MDEKTLPNSTSTIHLSKKLSERMHDIGWQIHGHVSHVRNNKTDVNPSLLPVSTFSHQMPLISHHRHTQSVTASMYTTSLLPRNRRLHPPANLNWQLVAAKAKSCNGGLVFPRQSL